MRIFISILLLVQSVLSLSQGNAAIGGNTAPAPAGQALVVQSTSTPGPSLSVEHAERPATLSSNPIMFVENVGQFPAAARFQVQGGRTTVWLSENAVWLTVMDDPDHELGPAQPSPTPEPAPMPDEALSQTGVNVRVSFLGANPHPRLEPFDPVDTHVSYFMGSDPTGWHTDVPAWGGVRYIDLYPGIDLELFAHQGQGLWRFIARDSASLETIRLQIEGADGLSQDSSNRLLIQVGSDTIIGPAVALISDKSPIRLRFEGDVVRFEAAVDEEENKPEERIEDTSAFEGVTGQLSCMVESQHPYANNSDLMWSVTNSQVNASSSRVHFSRLETETGFDYVRLMDQDNNVIQTISGYYPNGLWSEPIPGRVVKVRLTTDSSITAWGFCLDQLTSQTSGELAYSTFLGGSGFDAGHAVAAGNGGVAYVTGETASSNFPVTPGAFDTGINGGRDIFVTKLQSAGNGITYSTFIGGSGNDQAFAIAVDGAGEVYLAGSTSSTNFPTTQGAFDTSFNGATDAIVVKLNATGTMLRFSTYLGGGSHEVADGLDIDASYAIYVAGYTASSGFPTTPGAYDTSFNGGSPYSDAFVTKLSPSGSALIYSTFLGGTSEDDANDIVLDQYGNAYVVGWTGSSNFPRTAGAFGAAFAGIHDVFVTKLNSSGSGLIYSGLIGGSVDDQAQSVAIDVSGAVYVTGQTNSVNFPTSPNAFDKILSGGWDGFVIKINPAGNGTVYSTYLGGSGVDCETSGIDRECVIAVDASGVAYVAGRTSSSDFPTTANGYDTTYNGVEDGFMVKLNPDGSGLIYSSFFGGSSGDQTLGVAVDTAGSAYITGRTYSSNFPVSIGAYDTSYNANGDVFVIKLGVGGFTSGPRVDPNNSSISAAPVLIPADGMTAATITVQLRSADGQPAWGKMVRLASNRGARDDILQPTEVTDSDGRTVGYIRSTYSGTSTVTATVYDDGVTLSQTANVYFDPYIVPNNFLFRMNQMVNMAIDSLDDIADDAQAIADDGAYFRGAVGSDAARLAVNLTFNMADVVAGVNQTWQLQKAARLACPGCYVPGTWNTQSSLNHPAATRLLDMGFTPLEGTAASRIAEFVGWGSPKFYGKVLNGGLRYITKQVAQEANRTIFASLEDGMTDVAYPAVRETAGVLANGLDTQRAHILANLPAMTPGFQSAYATDFTRRSLALLTLGRHLDDERMTLANFRAVQAQQPNGLLNFVLRFTAKGLATVFFDGPGSIAVGGSLAAFDGYMDGKQLSESTQMYGLATGALLGAPDALRQTYRVANTALDHASRAVPANPAYGRVNSVSHRSQGTGWGPFWSETASWADVSLTNTGSTETTYRVLVGYLADTTRFGLPWATMHLVEEAAITLAPGATGTARVDFKRSGGTKGFSPRSQICIPIAGCAPASDIDVQVLGTNDAGTYYIDNYNSVWQPTRALLAGMPAQVVEEDSPIIDPPLTTFALSAPWTQQHEIQLWINNPFTTTLPVTIIQPLPGDITVLNVGGGVLSDDGLIWNTVVDPSSLGAVGFTFRFASAPGTARILAPATMYLINPLNGQLLTATSNEAPYEAIWPITVEYSTPGYVLPNTSATAVIAVKNWLTDQPVAGTLTLNIVDSWTGANMFAETRPFNVGSGATSDVSFPLPTSLPKGEYLIFGSVSANGASTNVFADTFGVGVPGPELDYEVMPMGPAHPGDVLNYTLRFSNTVGVPLTSAVVTASLPINVTVVPGSITGGGVIQPNQISWPLGAIGVNQTIVRSFAVQVDSNAAPPFGAEPAILTSTPRLTASQIAPTWGPFVWNLVPASSQPAGRMYLPLIRVSTP